MLLVFELVTFKTEVVVVAFPATSNLLVGKAIPRPTSSESADNVTVFPDLTQGVFVVPDADIV